MMNYTFGPPENDNVPLLDSLKKRIEEHCQVESFLNPPIYLAYSGWDNDKICRAFPRGTHDFDLAMWSRPYGGGLALAQYILDNPAKFSDKNVLDIGSGSGIVAIAAAKVGARVLAVDSNPVARHAIQLNAARNNVTLNSVFEHGTAERLYTHADIITAADVFYYRYDITNGSIAYCLKKHAENGKTVYATSTDSDVNLKKLFSLCALSIESIGVPHGGTLSFVKLEPLTPPPKIPPSPLCAPKM